MLAVHEYLILSAAKYKCGGLDSSKAVIVAGCTTVQAYWIWKGMLGSMWVSLTYMLVLFVVMQSPSCHMACHTLVCIITSHALSNQHNDL